MPDPIDATLRGSLPIPDRVRPHLTTYDAKDPEAKLAPIQLLRPPEGAPNVLLILIDDAGFGSSSAFGGPCQTPSAERLAAGGLKYTRFHTTALCSPTRAALLSGRNHHTVNMGSITEVATSAPGQTSLRPNSCAPLAEVLKLNGYNTAQFGKCHEVPVWETSPLGPFDHWPSPGGGFEYFYGFIGGETSQYYPTLYEGTIPVEPPKTPEEGYHLTEDLADRTIAWIRQQKALMPDKPFFVYFAPGATHAPHHVPKEWADKYKGTFDQGWDTLREETFARQKQLGVIPQDCDLSPRHEQIPAWDSVSDEMKPVLSRQMEVYAGFMEHTDHHIGRLLDALDELQITDDTLVILMIGDNGASAEGTLQGTSNEFIPLSGFLDIETPEFMRAQIDKLGTVESYNHYAVGWAHAMDTPYQWTKQVASHWGGVRNGTIVHWPKGIKAKGQIRNQFAHVIDVAPTVLEVAGLPEPLSVNGVQQQPLEGVSFAYSLDDGQAAERHTTQYFEMLGNRGIYHNGWVAGTRHRTPWITGAVKLPAFDDDIWELYDTNTDWTQAHDLAAKNPEKLHELQRQFLIEAVKYNVLPLDDRGVERAIPDVAGRPQLIRGDRQVLWGGMKRLSEGSVISLKNKSHAITAEVVVPDAPAEGVIVALGGNTGGWSVYTVGGKLTYCYNFFGLERFKVQSTDLLPAGNHQVRVEFAYDGGGVAKGGAVTLYVDGAKAGEGRVERTVPTLFSATETCDVGCDLGAPVTDDYKAGDNAFTGTVTWVELAFGEDAEDLDHLISPEEWMQLLTAIH